MQSDSKGSLGFSNSETGKRVGRDLYLHVSAFTSLPTDQQQVVAQASECARLTLGEHFNVVRFAQGSEHLSLLDYPNFFEDPFPTLARSWRISPLRKSVVFRNYTESRNPPILHRKELLLPATDPRIPQFSSITKSAELLGLFDEPNKIGFREHWYKLIAERGYELVGNEFLPLANVQGISTAPAESDKDMVQRHRTALKHV